MDPSVPPELTENASSPRAAFDLRNRLSQSARLTSTRGEPEAESDSLVAQPGAERLKVLFDSYHAHNFLHRGLVPGEYVYHRYSALRRAAQLLEARGCEVDELLVGPLTRERLADVKLLVVNLPSMDRPPWLVQEVEAVNEFVRGGGGVIFITDHSNCYYHQYHLLPLWDKLELIPTFETACERDPGSLIMRTGPGWFVVRDFSEHPLTNQVRAFAMQTGGRVVGDGIVARTSDKAWADAGIVPLYGEGSPGLIGDMKYSDSEESGTQGVVLAREVGRGRIVIIADQNSVGDAAITYADNWRLWLGAASWCGRLELPDLTRSFLLHTPAETQQNPSASEPPAKAGAEPNIGSWIDSLGEEDSSSETQKREAQALQTINAWSVHCWEPIARSRFRFGGLEKHQYYGLFCYLNRFRWTTANDRLDQPVEHQGTRSLLLACIDDLDDAALVQAARGVLHQGGKVILLESEPAMSLDELARASQQASDPLQQFDMAPPADQAEPFSSPSQELREKLQRAATILTQGPTPELADDELEKAPVMHWSIQALQGELVLVPSTRRLSNTQFLLPEVAPDGRTAKWEKSLRDWLFDVPPIAR